MEKGGHKFQKKRQTEILGNKDTKKKTHIQGRKTDARWHGIGVSTEGRTDNILKSRKRAPETKIWHAEM